VVSVSGSGKSTVERGVAKRPGRELKRRCRKTIIVRIDKTVAAIVGEIVTALSLQRASMTVPA
jgi:hypothetical protein